MSTSMVACWNCGHSNASDARFCSNCGKPQAQGPIVTTEARKIVTVLFADLAGSTSLTERLDPEEAREVFAKFYRVVEEAVRRFDGTVANLLGDAVLAVFGFPAAHEDDPERAVRAGMELRDAVPGLNEQLQLDHDVTLGVRVGINTGEVVGATGSTFDRDFLISDAVTTAARLQQSVAPGVVAVGERTYRQTREVIEYHPLPPLEIKGKETPVPIWEPLAPLPERPETWRIAAPLMGRKAELGLLRSLFDRTREEALPHLVTILGQPGIGKSRLLREFLGEAREADAPPLFFQGRSLALGSQVGYHALLSILRTQAGLQDTDSPARVRRKMTAWLDRGLAISSATEREAILEGLLLTSGSPDGQSGDPLAMRGRLFEAWRGLLRALAATQPVIVAFEDLHWADDGVLDLIEWLGAQLDGASVFLMCLTRPELLERRPTWGAGSRNTTTIDLKPLRESEAHQLVSALGTAGLSPDLRSAITARAEGNPLFVEELVRMMLDGGGAGTTVPDTVQAVLMARIDRLPADERRVLQAAAVVGRVFWPSAVVPLAGAPEDDVVRAIETLVAKEMVIAHRESTLAGDREFAFRHILTRDVAYNMLPRLQRQRAHALAGTWLEQRLGTRIDEVVDVLAEHFRLGGDDVRAARYLQHAGDKARRLYANADAIRFYDQALAAATRAGAPPGQLAGLHLARGEAHEMQAAYPQAMVEFERGLALSQQTDDLALQAVLLNRLGLVHHREAHIAEAEGYFKRSAELARAAGDRNTLGRSLLDLANVGWDRGETRPEDPALNEGIALLRAAGDRPGLARGLNLLSMTHFMAGHATPAIAAAREAMDVARAAGDRSKEATALSYLSTIKSFFRMFREGIVDGEAALQIAEEIGDRRRAAFVMSIIAEDRLVLGEWGEGVRVLEASLPLIREHSRLHLPFALMWLGLFYAELGHTARAREHMVECIALDPSHPIWRAATLMAKAGLARIDGDSAALNDALDEILRIPSGLFVPDEAQFLPLVADYLFTAGRVEDARVYFERFRPWMAQMEPAADDPGLLYYEARLALADGSPETAGALLDRSIAAAEVSEDAFWQWKSLELRLDLLGRDDDRRALRALLSRCAATLPDDVRESFLQTPSGAFLRGGVAPFGLQEAAGGRA